MWTFSIMMFAIVVIMGLSAGLTPLFSRQSTPFGVGIPDEHLKNPFIEKRKRSFALINIVLSVIVALPLLATPFYQKQPRTEVIVGIYLTVIIFVFILFSFLLQLKYRKEILAWKQTLPQSDKKAKIVVDTTYHETLDVVSNRTFLVSQLVIIGFTVAITLYFYDRIPEQIPVHWDINWNADRYAEKSLITALGLPFMQAIMLPVLNLSHYSFIKSKQKLSPNKPVVSKKKSQLFRKAWSTYFFIMAVSTQLLMTIIQFFSVLDFKRDPSWMMIIIVIYIVITIIGTFYLLLKYGQAGEKLKIAYDDNEPSDYYTDPEEDKNWKLGVFYYNKEDPAVFVEKRFGIGSTINMARWQAWLLIAGLVLFIVLTIAVSMYMS